MQIDHARDDQNCNCDPAGGAEPQAHFPEQALAQLGRLNRPKKWGADHSKKEHPSEPEESGKYVDCDNNVVSERQDMDACRCAIWR